MPHQVRQRQVGRRTDRQKKVLFCYNKNEESLFLLKSKDVFWIHPQDNNPCFLHRNHETPVSEPLHLEIYFSKFYYILP